MWKTLAEKLLKSELWVALVAIGASAASKRLGLPDEVIADFIYSMTGIAVAYIGGRSVVKTKDAAARDLSLRVTPPGL